MNYKKKFLFAAGMGLFAALSCEGKVFLSDELLTKTTPVVTKQGKEYIRASDEIVSLAHQINIAVAGNTAEEIARQYLALEADKYGLNKTQGDLELDSISTGLVSTVVRFQQTIDGIPVYKSRIIVTLDKSSKVQFVVNDVSLKARSGLRVPAISTVRATEIAIAWLLVGNDAQVESSLVYFPDLESDNQTLRLTHKVRVFSGQVAIGHWDVFVDAETGNVIASESLLHNGGSSVNGSGMVFDPDPLSRMQASYSDPGYSDNNDATSPQLDAARSSVVLPDITWDGLSTYRLVGPHAEIVDHEAPFNGLFSQSTDQFNFNRFDAAFEAVSCYYHVHHMMRYLNSELGLNIIPYQYAGGVQCDPHGLSGQDNSHYSVGSGRLAFGEGGVDDAEDADVIIHELGHGLHDWVTAGGLSQVNGLSEGVGDFLASSYSRKLDNEIPLWTSADPEFHWMFSWDGHNEYWNGRLNNVTRLYPDDLIGQVHTDGELWSTTMMQIWNDLGRDKTERAHWEGLRMTGSSTNQEQAAQAVLDAAVMLEYSHADIQTMLTHFLNRGYNVSVNSILADGFE